MAGDDLCVLLGEALILELEPGGMEGGGGDNDERKGLPLALGKAPMSPPDDEEGGVPALLKADCREEKASPPPPAEAVVVVE